jgi:MYXO-CTERM domain-containing protein
VVGGGGSLGDGGSSAKGGSGGQGSGGAPGKGGSVSPGGTYGTGGSTSVGTTSGGCSCTVGRHAGRSTFQVVVALGLATLGLVVRRQRRAHRPSRVPAG